MYFFHVDRNRRRGRRLYINYVTEMIVRREGGNVSLRDYGTTETITGEQTAVF
jgi:hypothetical protein